ENAWMELSINPDISNQPGFSVCPCIGFIDQIFQEIERFQLQQHLLHGRIHSVERIDQRAMPVENDEVRTIKGLQDERAFAQWLGEGYRRLGFNTHTRSVNMSGKRLRTDS